jgi:hypothetical protein
MVVKVSRQVSLTLVLQCLIKCITSSEQGVSVSDELLIGRNDADTQDGNVDGVRFVPTSGDADVASEQRAQEYKT